VSGSLLLHVLGKRVVRQETLQALPAGNLIYLRDSLSSRKFLVDSGASVSVFPDHSSPLHVPTLRLHTADGSLVPCKGQRTIPLKFGSSSYQWSFYLAPVQIPILGADFLRHFRLLVDVVGSRILDSSTLQPVCHSSASQEESTTLRATLLSTPESIRRLIDEYQDVLSSDGFSAAPPKHNVRHHISTEPGLPVFAKARRLDPSKLSIAKAEFLAMEKAGIIRRSKSPWSSPLHMVPKKVGGVVALRGFLTSKHQNHPG